MAKPVAEYLLELIMEGNVAATFPNVMTVLRLLLILPCGAALAERSVSILKRIKHQCRATMCQERLDALGLMASNSDGFDKNGDGFDNN